LGLTKYMQNILSLKDFRTKLTDYTKRVSEKGDSFVVFKKSKPVFMVVPIDHDGEWQTVLNFSEINPKGVTFKDIRKAAKELL